MLDFCASTERSPAHTAGYTAHVLRSEPLKKDRNEIFILNKYILNNKYLFTVFTLRVCRLNKWRFDVSEAAVWMCVDYDEDHVCQHAPALFPLNFSHVCYIYCITIKPPVSLMG